ncbi:MAG: class I SAM-dependent methyltransferase [Gammaproteobacteria bacterium]|nr:class I SAM-dependent methyltransferase [Gammaproteobacteria bacterium]MBU2478161.1 class I SAM-dependent methyltransferase [Gammaproteobacteria bacterium]
MEPVVETYGWQNPSEACAHDYIKPTILRILRQLAPRKILDLGCGNGALTHALRKAGYQAMGCDADSEGIAFAQTGGGDFKVVSVYEDPIQLGDSGFDCVVSAEVIEHLFTPGALPRFAHKVLAPNGHLVITTPYHGYAKNLILSLLNKWDTHIDPMWDGGHIKLWSRTTLTRLLEKNGFTVIEFHGVGRFPYLWKSMILVARRIDT